ncbi:MAG: vitamin B12-dependent ribonucleotide reductase [Turicibacter sp.]|nr:vitamin B12-dependent ribonucleotide reductase [Turicibacter sp.]
MKLEKITRHFTASLTTDGNKSVYDLFDWKKVEVKIINHSTGAIITHMTDLEFPQNYSQSACDIIAGKYFRKKGLAGENGGIDAETSMRQLVHRMVSFWVNSMKDEGLVDTEQAKIVYDELAFMLLAQMWAPNSPQWFNTGLFHAYGIKGSKQGHYFYDPQTKSVVKSADAYTRTQGSACFIISILDTLLGEKSLTDQLVTESLLFKYGSGVGTNWSSIRAKNELLSGGGKSSGLLSFLKVSDRNAGAIKSGGTTRRAAKMNILNLDHPEILDFIRWKSLEEDKVAALGKMGYSTSMDGEAYETVSGQNANNSIRVSNAFMYAIEGQSDDVWRTTGRVDGRVDSEIKASEIWETAADAAWRCGDPGVQYDDTINAWHTCPAGEDGDLGAAHNRINASNPCSEYMFLDDTACNLASINICRFYNTETGKFELNGYIHAIGLIQMVLEATIHWGQFPTKDIARKSHLFRTTGLGLTNLGALFMHMGLPYDSDEARHLAAALCSIMTGQSYAMSAMMAEKIGAFECYELNKEHMNRVIRNHARAAAYNPLDQTLEEMPYTPEIISHKVLRSLGLGEISDALCDIWGKTIELGKNHGFRNAQVTVLAPTGTIAFAMDCATTSSEPFFSHVVYKKLVGGSNMTIVNPIIPLALKRLNYSADEIAAIEEYVLRKDENGSIIDGKIEGAPFLKTEHLGVFDTASKCGTGKRFIEPLGHVKMMAALTPHITGAISKTVNLPKEATVADIREIYRISWQLGVKAIAIYRDGCKVSQVLYSAKTAATEKPLSDFTYNELIEHINEQKNIYNPKRVKPSGIRPAKVHKADINGLTLYITTSYYEDGRLAEIFASTGRQGSLAKGLLESLSITISKMLQYGIAPKYIASMYRGQKYEPNGYVSDHPYIKQVDSISDLISKIIDIEMGDYTNCQVKPQDLDEVASEASEMSEAKVKVVEKAYSAADYLYGEICPDCSSTKMVKNGTCKVCTECGSTTGCS